MLFVTLNQAGEQHGDEDLWHPAALFTKIGVASFSLFLCQSRKMCVCNQLWQITSVGTWLALWITFIFLKVKIPAKQCFTKHYDMGISSGINMLATRIMIQSDGNSKHLTPLTLFFIFWPRYQQKSDKNNSFNMPSVSGAHKFSSIAIIRLRGISTRYHKSAWPLLTSRVLWSQNSISEDLLTLGKKAEMLFFYRPC